MALEQSWLILDKSEDANYKVSTVSGCKISWQDQITTGTVWKAQLIKYGNKERNRNKLTVDIFGHPVSFKRLPSQVFHLPVYT